MDMKILKASLQPKESSMKQLYPSQPTITEPIYLAGFIERMGTGTGDIIRLCKEKGLKEPEFIQEENFRAVIRRTGQATRQATGEITETVIRIVLVLDGEMKRIEIQELLGLKDRENFALNYLTSSLESAYIEMTIPEIPTHQDQPYRLTAKGLELKQKLNKSKDVK
jgi:predicted HTH transcriptional regulator